MISDDDNTEHAKAEKTSELVSLIIQPKRHDLGGFLVRRALPHPRQRMVGPWIFFDHIGPAQFQPGQGIDVRPHPHINLATVTYLFEGELFHRDSLSNALPISPGEINLMVAGNGIVHSERQRDEVKAENNRLHGLQLWMALPDDAEEIDPEFHHYDASEIPRGLAGSVEVSVLIGTAYNLNSPVKTFTPTLYVEAWLKTGEQLALPDTVEQRAIYVVNGKLAAESLDISQYSMAVFEFGKTVVIRALENSHIVILGGAPMPRRHIWWNFVSSRKQRIEQAPQDWKTGVFKAIPGDETEFIPLPE